MGAVMKENLECSPAPSWKPARTISCEINDADSSSEDEAPSSSMSNSPLRTSQIPPRRLKPNACVFVGSMPPMFRDEELADIISKIFAPFGPVMSLKLLRDRQNRPYSFVQLLSQDKARKAISRLDKYIIGTRKILCEPARVNRTLLLWSKSFDIEQLYETAGLFGEIERTDIVGAGQCSVMYEFREDAVRAYHDLSQFEEPQVRWIQNIEPDTANSETIYIGGMPLCTSILELENLVGQYGPLVWCDIRHMDSANDSVYAVIRLASRATATAAIEHMNHMYFKGRVIKVQRAAHSLGDRCVLSAPRPLVEATAESTQQKPYPKKRYTKVLPMSPRTDISDSRQPQSRALRLTAEKE